MHKQIIKSFVNISHCFDKINRRVTLRCKCYSFWFSISESNSFGVSKRTHTHKHTNTRAQTHTHTHTHARTHARTRAREHAPPKSRTRSRTHHTNRSGADELSWCNRGLKRVRVASKLELGSSTCSKTRCCLHLPQGA